MGRSNWYEPVEEMQTDLDNYLKHYNNKRPHQGRSMNGKTPYAMLLKGLPKPEKGGTKRSKKAA